MTVEVKVDEITEAVYESNRKWVSVEAELDYALNPVTLFQLTESDFNDRFYFRKNDDSMSFFGYKALKKYKNDVEKKQSIFHEWEKDRKDISFIHPCSEQHHLKLCGGFQFSAHKSDDEWRQFGINHFILPEVLVTIKGDHSYITYTTERETFDIDDFQAIISHLTSTVETTPEDMGAIKKQDDIYKDEWRDLVQQTIEQLDESKKNRVSTSSFIFI
ncbi:menaquinone-specific isochorismate synthase [Staphylococcus auricularis]|nr:menaquinone-specific isochorismate synthase [Staphylococcus auricularis]